MKKLGCIYVVEYYDVGKREKERRRRRETDRYVLMGERLKWGKRGARC